MMVINFNTYFNPLAKMTPDEFDELRFYGRLWSTRALFSGEAAEAVMGPPPTGFHYPVNKVYYHGYIVTKKGLDLEEAKVIAAARGFNEEVVWLVERTEPLGESPMQLFQN